MKWGLGIGLSWLLAVGLAACDRPPRTAVQECRPTPFDEIGPFYRPGAPLRNSVGKGYVLAGRVLSSAGCLPLPGSRIEFWLVNPQGEYDDAHRATVIADGRGAYRFESNRPTDYVDRKPHIHIKVTSEGHEELITQHYPSPEAIGAGFDLIIAPLPKK